MSGGELLGVGNMADQHKRDEWLQDIEDRQRSVVFPNTVENEARFWRNLGTTPSSTVTKIGLAVLAIFVFGFASTILIATYAAGVLWFFLLGMLLFCGSLFGAIAWATRRNLQRLESSRTASKRPRR